MNNKKGFTLVELLVVIAMMGVLIAISSMGFDVLYRQRLTSATAEFIADLQTARMNALTQNSDPASRGFGLIFDPASDNSYRVFEFLDNGGGDLSKADNFEYDAGEEVIDFHKILPSGISVEIGVAGDHPDGEDNALFYDKRGLLRSKTWSSGAPRTYVLRHPRVTDAKCVTVSRVRIRGGNWDGAICNLQ